MPQNTETNQFIQKFIIDINSSLTDGKFVTNHKNGTKIVDYTISTLSQYLTGVKKNKTSLKYV